MVSDEEATLTSMPPRKVGGEGGPDCPGLTCTLLWRGSGFYRFAVFIGHPDPVPMPEFPSASAQACGGSRGPCSLRQSLGCKRAGLPPFRGQLASQGSIIPLERHSEGGHWNSHKALRIFLSIHSREIRGKEIRRAHCPKAQGPWWRAACLLTSVPQFDQAEQGERRHWHFGLESGGTLLFRAGMCGQPRAA